MAGINSEADDNISDLAEHLQNLLNSLAGLGYPLAQIDSIVHSADSVYSVIDICLSEGPKAVGIQHIDDNQFPNYSESETEISEIGILSTVNSVLTELTNSGFPFASVVIVPEEIRKSTDSLVIDLHYEVCEGDFVRINSLTFPGQLFPKSNLLNLESRIKRGDVFSSEILDRGIQRIKKLENIESVGSIRLQSSSPGIVDVVIPVSERSINRFSGIATINPDDGKPSGEAKISFGNIFGTGRKLDFTWSGLSRGQQGIQVRYREPWLFSYPLHLDIGMNRLTDDTLETLTRYQLEMNWEPGLHVTIGANLSRELIVRSLFEQNDEQTNTIWMGAFASVNYLDNDWNPTKGFQFSSRTATGIRTPEHESASETIHREDVAFRFAFPVKSSIIAYLNGETKHLTGNNINQTEMIRIGGLNSVRGYSEERFRALACSWLNTELRWRADLNSYYGIFGDFGFIHRENPQYQASLNYLSSYGVVSEFITRAGRIGFALGLASGEPIQQSRLHFSIQTWF